MIPQHSSPAPAASRCRDALQVNVCTEYKSVHVSDHITSSDSRHIVPNGGLLSCCVPPSEIGGRMRNTESIFRPANELMCIGIARFTSGCSGGSQLRFSPIDKHNKFNRMNGSPGDPPANRMHILSSKNSTPLIHYHVSNLATMAASRGIPIFNHFLYLRTSSQTELTQARMQGSEINNNSTKNKG
jgi:hypothetical protein